MTNSQTTKFDNLRNFNPIGVCHHAEFSIDQQSQQTSSAPTKNFLFTYPHLFLIFHHHRRKKSPAHLITAQHSKSFDIFHFYTFVRLNLFPNALARTMHLIGDSFKAMQMVNSWCHRILCGDTLCNELEVFLSKRKKQGVKRCLSLSSL